VYEDIFDAKNACEHLSGFNVGGRYLSVLYYQVNKGQAAKGAGTLAQQEAEVAALRARVAAGEAAGGGAEDSLDDDADKKLMKR
jgi:pre-mRNA branch site protein p14